MNLFKTIAELSRSSIQNTPQTFSFCESKRVISEPITTKLNIVKKEKINHDCYLYQMKFNGESFPLKIGHHFRVIENVKTVSNPEGEELMRYYTPISSCEDFSKGKIEMLIKIYRPNENIIYPSGGKLTPFIESLEVGKNFNIEGPFGKFTYETEGNVCISKTLYSEDVVKHKVKKLFLIAGGTGITPIYQVLSEIANIKDDTTELTLLFCNKTEKDIILKDRLEKLRGRIKIHYMLDHAPEGWTQLQGRISKQNLSQIHRLDDPDAFYLFCGPKAMNLAIKNIFSENYPDSKIHKI